MDIVHIYDNLSYFTMLLYENHYDPISIMSSRKNPQLYCSLISNLHRNIVLLHLCSHVFRGGPSFFHCLKMSILYQYSTLAILLGLLICLAGCKLNICTGTMKRPRVAGSQGTTRCQKCQLDLPLSWPLELLLWSIPKQSIFL